MKVFLSYVDSNKGPALEIKNQLEQFGFNVFLAHDDIPPAKAWAEAIMDNLQDSDIFIPILTKGFDQSMYVNQEVGFAIGSGKLIFPVKIEIDPPGFLAPIQALKWDVSKLFPIKTLVRAINEELYEQKKMRKFIIEKLQRSTSIHETIITTEHLILLDGYSKSEIKKIINVCINNKHVYDAIEVKEILGNFIRKRKIVFEKELMDAFNMKMI